MSHFRYRDLGDEALQRLAGEMAAGLPFPHVVIPDFISIPAEEVLAAFPDPDDPVWRHLTDAHEPHKMTVSDVDRMREPLASMTRELASPSFLRFLEQVTGISGLIPDPHLQGAGLHCTGPDGVTALHTDTHINERLRIFRRVNTLIYLNPQWQEAFGGCLGFYDPRDLSRPLRLIIPSWGTCVIFRSDERSVHGFTHPVSVGRLRRSIAAYYYTSVDAPDFGGGFLTNWLSPPARDQRGLHGLRRAGGVQTLLYRSLRLASKTFAHLAHRVRPRTFDRGR